MDTKKPTKNIKLDTFVQETTKWCQEQAELEKQATQKDQEQPQFLKFPFLKDKVPDLQTKIIEFDNSKTKIQAQPPQQTSQLSPNKKHSLTSSGSSTNKRIKSYDYKGWDKLDVEDELKKVDQIDEAEMRKKREANIQEASSKKDNGNQCFNKGQYDLAIDYYTQAMELDPDNVIYPANRAMAYLCNKRYLKAAEDCTKAISLDKTYIKAYIRRGVARRNLGHLLLAKQDLEIALKLEPKNTQAQKELTEVTLLLKEEEKKKVRIAEVEQENLVAVETKLQPHESKKPEKQAETTPITITEVTSAPVIPIQQQITTATKTQYTTPEPKKLITDPKPSEATIKPSLISEVEPVKDRKETSAKPTIPAQITSPQPQPQPQTLENIPIKLLIPKEAPKTAYEFENYWLSLRKDLPSLAQYFKLISPKSYADLFKESMTEEMLKSIIHLLEQYYLGNEPQYTLEVLQQLPTMKRFDMLLMFMDTEEKQVLLRMLDKLQQSGLINDQETGTLKAAYDLL